MFAARFAASTWVCLLAEDLPDGVHRLGEEVVTVEMLFERVASLDVGEATVTVCRGRAVAEV